jgi:hypothetical protein
MDVSASFSHPYYFLDSFQILFFIIYIFLFLFIFCVEPNMDNNTEEAENLVVDRTM